MSEHNMYVSMVSADEMTELTNTIELQKMKIIELKKLLDAYISYTNFLENNQRWSRKEDKEV